jgi:hypothetical protein
VAVESLGAGESEFKCFDLLHQNQTIWSNNSEESETTPVLYAATVGC